MKSSNQKLTPRLLNCQSGEADLVRLGIRIFLGYYHRSTFQPCRYPRQHDIQPYGCHFAALPMNANVGSRWSRPRQGGKFGACIRYYTILGLPYHMFFLTFLISVRRALL